MQDGDLSNDIAPKLFFVVEGLITRVSPDHEKAAAKARKRQRYHDLATVSDLDTMMIAHLWDIMWRTPFNFEFITVESSSEAWLAVLEKKLDRYNVPYSGLMGFDSPDHLARHIVFMPNILRMYHGHADWGFKFGRLGEYVSDAQTFQVS